ncbi:hypothetical protein AX17_006983 [Amanita inopinata Kibby_2008]|nr:hypothetical protein AX17_006983 [Amanita inopinata Kibby_2008]
MSTDDHSTMKDPEKFTEPGTTDPSSDSTLQPTDFPEGGLRAWMVVVGSFLVQFCTFGYTNGFGVYNDYYVRVYLNENHTSSQISWIGSVQLMLVLSMGLITGRAFDAGYFYHLIIGGSILFVFSLFMLSLAQPQQYYQVFLAQGLALSTAIGMLYIPSLAIISHYFRRRRAFVMGISASGSAVGGTIHPIMLNQLFHGRAGFRNGVRASAALNFGLLIIAMFLMKPRLPPKKLEGNLLRSFSTFLREPAYVFTTLGTVFAISGIYFPIFFLQLNAIQQGLNATLAFYTITILNGASTFGRVAPNLIVHRCGVFNAIILCTGGCVIMIFSVLAVKSAAGIILFSILYGFFTGAYIGLLAPMLSSLAKTDAEIGARMGICFTFTGIGGLIGNPIAGALLGPSFVWWRPILFAGLCVVCASLCFSSARFLIAKRKGTQFV